MSPMSKALRNPDVRKAFWISLGIMVLASIPYIFGYGITPTGYKFVGFTYNIDDACVYMSWMRQAADGHFFLRNLFTTEPQTGHGFNLLFLFMGTFARVTHLPLVFVFHLWRTVFGLALLMAVYGFAGIWLRDARSRLVVLLVVGLSAGLGWMIPSGLRDNLSIDTWQSEAITFTSVYLSPLYSFPILLMIGAVYCLHRFTEDRSWRYAVYAGLILLLLANVHTYDTITLAVMWALYSVYRLAHHKDARPSLGGLASALIASPMVAYQLYFYHTEPIFRMRVAVPTLTYAFRWYLMGYGFLVPLALIGVWKSFRRRPDVALLVCWAVAGFVATHLPVSFQRKLIMGTHIPLGIMASLGLVSITENLKPRMRYALIAVVIAIMAISNMRVLCRDSKAVVYNESQTIAHVPFISDAELAAMDYLRMHAGTRDVVLATPGTAILVPGYSGKTVYCGHWGETVGFEDKLRELIRFYTPGAPDSERTDFLNERGITYVIGYHNQGELKTDVEDFREQPVPYLVAVFDSEEVSVYRVLRDAL